MVRNHAAFDVLPSNVSVRTRVHEYGGGSYCLGEDSLYYVEEQSQQVFVRTAAGRCRQLSSQPNARFADMIECLSLGLLICVRETHSEEQVVNELVGISLRDGVTQVLASGADFYSSPRLSDCETKLAFISWDHPHMPWQQNRLWVAECNAIAELGELTEVRSQGASSKSQPIWREDGSLIFLDDAANGWWNLTHYRGGECSTLAPIEADLGRAQWDLGASSLAIAGNSVFALGSKHGQERLMLLDDQARTWLDLGVAQTQMSHLCHWTHGLGYLGASPLSGQGVYTIDSHLRTQRTVLGAAALPLDEASISTAESFQFKARNGSSAQGFFYAPVNSEVGIASEPPPLVVVMHGGPTSACNNAFKAQIQYWTTRGFAVFDINYRGSTGFGRNYRLGLAKQWGVVDVEDCVDGVEALVRAGKVDRERIVIRGGSAGGYTALAAAASSDVFAAVGCHYGVADLTLLARDTHKFESRYLDHLIGPYPEQKRLYEQRSPINRLEHIKCPVFISHGELDQVVPVNQAHAIYNALSQREQVVELLLFADERHGYAKEDNIAKLLKSELGFYIRVFEKQGE
ncbi:MAG: alpha/beta hydrolase family protein [Granulosicoccaceae bacterium]